MFVCAEVSVPSRFVRKIRQNGRSACHVCESIFLSLLPCLCRSCSLSLSLCGYVRWLRAQPTCCVKMIWCLCRLNHATKVSQKADETLKVDLIDIKVQNKLCAFRWRHAICIFCGDVSLKRCRSPPGSESENRHCKVSLHRQSDPRSDWISANQDLAEGK